MKKFYAWVLVYLISFVGMMCVGMIGNIAKKDWLGLLILIGSMVVAIPAINWWRDYFYKIFDIKN